MLWHLPLMGLRVLVVEDDAPLASDLVEHLEACGAVPLGPMRSVSQALRSIEASRRVDAALLDVVLRDEVSFPVAEELRRRDIPFVFLTDHAEIARARFPDAAVHSKPISMTRVVQTLAAVVAARRRR